MSLDSKILQILDNSACLSKGQLSGYLSRSLYPEELRAVELHLSECPFCSDALDGFEQEQEAQKILQSIEKIPVLPALAPKESKAEAVLDKVVKTVTPKAPVARVSSDSHAAGGRDGAAARNTASTVREISTKKPHRNRWLKPLGVAAGIAAIAVLLWRFQFDKDNGRDAIADNRNDISEQAPVAAEKDQTASPATASAPLAQNNAPVKPLKDTIAVQKLKKAGGNDTGKQMAALATEAKIAKDERKTQQASAVPVADVPAPQQETLRAVAADAAMNEKPKPTARPAIKPEESSPDEPSDKKKPAKQDDKMSDYEMGVALYKQKQYGSALLYLKPAQRNAADPKHYDAVYYSALCYKNSGQKKKAIRLFKKLVEDGAPQKSSAQKQLIELGEE